MSTPRKSAVHFEHIKLEDYGYVNINKFHESPDQLHCCETLFGDYDAEVMLLGQDQGEYETFKELKDMNDPNDPNPYRHDPKRPTNIMLHKLMSSYFDVDNVLNSTKAQQCGLYFANAIWLLRERARAKQKHPPEAFEVCHEIFAATLNNLPNLKLIIVMGEDAHDYMKKVISNLPDKLWDFVKRDTPIQGTVKHSMMEPRQLFVGAMYHPSRIGTRLTREVELNPDVKENSIDLTRRDLERMFTVAGVKRPKIR
jgi:hypothetical protein